MNLHKSAVKQLGCIFLLITFCGAAACDEPFEPGNTSSDQFETTPEKFPVFPGIIDEASGLASSENMKGYLWTHQDSGAPPALYLISKDGKSVRTYSVPGTQNHDWEDIAIGPGPVNAIPYLFIADTGNNNAPVTATNVIYRVPELASQNASFLEYDVHKITFQYPDGPRDAESILIDPDSRDIIIISKEGTSSGIYRLPFPQSTSGTMTAKKEGTIPGITTATSGAVSRDGKEILIRTYLAAYYWKKKDGENMVQTLLRSSDKQLLVALEPQGEAICFDSETRGFYTLSERANSSGVNLNFYKRN